MKTVILNDLKTVGASIRNNTMNLSYHKLFKKTNVSVRNKPWIKINNTLYEIANTLR
jgi:hypothetical protein